MDDGIRIINATRGCVLVTRGRVADGYWSRLRGLIGAAPLAPGEGLLISPCTSVHTHFMGFSIDVIYVNQDNEVVGIDAGMAPWRFGRFYRRVRYVVELPAGTASATGTRVGDRLEIHRPVD
jgi:uncharacterized protein